MMGVLSDRNVESNLNLRGYILLIVLYIVFIDSIISINFAPRLKLTHVHEGNGLEFIKGSKREVFFVHFRLPDPTPAL